MGLKVLIVEDEPLVALLLEDYLNLLGHKAIDTLDNIDAALKAIEQGGFDAAILDKNIADQHIWPVARALKQTSIPFIIASGDALVGDSPEYAPYSNAPLLRKPYTLAMLETLLKQIL